MKKLTKLMILFLTFSLLMGCNAVNIGNISTKIATKQTLKEAGSENLEIVTSEESFQVEMTEEVTTEAETTIVETSAYVPNFENMTLAVGCEANLDLPENLENVKVESSYPDIVSVDENGVIKALEKGASDVTVTIDGESYAFEVVATTPEISEQSITKIMGNTVQLYIYGTTGVPVFESDNTAIASVTENGLVTAEPTGVGQSTKIHVTVDKKEFIVDVNVEPVPQLLSSYEVSAYGGGMYQVENPSTDSAPSTLTTYRYDNANIELIANTSEVVHTTPQQNPNNGYNWKPESVLNIGSVDYSSGDVYPLYRGFVGKGGCIRIYLVGSSQNADVMVKLNGVFESKAKVKYIASDGYGIIEYKRDDPIANLYESITVVIDGYTYQFAVVLSNHFKYTPDLEEELSEDFEVKECTVDGVVAIPYRYTGKVRSKASTFYGAMSDIGVKIVEAAEDEAINYVVGKVFTLIF